MNSSPFGQVYHHCVSSKNRRRAWFPCVERSAYKVRWLSDGRWKCDRGPSGCGVYTGNQHRSIETNKYVHCLTQCLTLKKVKKKIHFNWYLIRNVHIWDLLDIFTISIGVYSAGMETKVWLLWCASTGPAGERRGPWRFWYSSGIDPGGPNRAPRVSGLGLSTYFWGSMNLI